MKRTDKKDRNPFLVHILRLLFCILFVLVFGGITVMFFRKSSLSYRNASYMAMDEKGRPWQLCLGQEGGFSLTSLISSMTTLEGGSYEQTDNYLILQYEAEDIALYFAVDGEKLVFRREESRYEPTSGTVLWGGIPLFEDGIVFTRVEGEE